jgi:hypothetical protein
VKAVLLDPSPEEDVENEEEAEDGEEAEDVQTDLSEALAATVETRNIKEEPPEPEHEFSTSPFGRPQKIGR